MYLQFVEGGEPRVLKHCGLAPDLLALSRKKTRSRIYNMRETKNMTHNKKLKVLLKIFKIFKCSNLLQTKVCKQVITHKYTEEILLSHAIIRVISRFVNDDFHHFKALRTAEALYKYYSYIHFFITQFILIYCISRNTQMCIQITFNFLLTKLPFCSTLTTICNSKWHTTGHPQHPLR